MNITPSSRRFHLSRIEDVSGVSGVGLRIAEGCVFSDGIAVVRWLSACGSTNIYPNLEAVLQVHGHAGNTEIIFDDPPPEVTHTPIESKKTIENSAKDLHAAVENTPGFTAVGVGGVDREELFVYSTKLSNYPEDFDGHKVTVIKIGKPRTAKKH